MESRVAVGDVVIRHSKGVLCALIAVLASGCGSVVYKDSASTFTAAGRTASTLIADSSKQLDTAKDAIREVKMTEDPECPINEPRLFIRTGNSASSVVNAGLNRFPNQNRAEGCQQLRGCEQAAAGPANKVPAECSKACYSKVEGNCLVQLETSYAKELNPRDGSPKPADPTLEKEATQFAVFLDSVEYRRANSVESKLVGSGIRGLTGYLDLLEKVTEERTSDLPKDAKKLSEKLGSISEELSKAKKEQLSDDDKKQQAKVQGAIGAIGKLAGTIQTMAKNYKDASEIKQLVNENQIDVNGLIESLHSIAVGDSLLASIYTDQANSTERSRLQQQYKKTTDPYSRSQLLAARENYKYSNGGAIVESVDAVFKSLEESHNSLVSLVNNPTDEQKKKIANQEFEEFKTVVKDLVDVVEAVK